MLIYPRLKYCYHAELLDDEHVLMLSEKKNAVLSGKLYRLILAEIQQGELSTEELIDRLDGRVSTAELVYALNFLQRKGYITESTSSVSPELCAYWNNMGIEVARLLETLEEKPVSVEFLGALPTDAFVPILETSGLSIRSDGVLRLIITDDYERQELREINREAMTAKQPWMLIKPGGVEVWIGPLFVPDVTGCWDCLAHRLTRNRPMQAFYKSRRGSEAHSPVPRSCSPMSFQLAANLAALEIIKWLYFEENGRIEGNVLSLDTLSCATRSHLLVKRPQCETCGEMESRNVSPRPIVLKKRQDVCISTQGGYRETALEDTVEKYQHHVSPITGVVQKLEPYFPEKDSPVHNYASGQNMALKSKTLLWLNHHVRNGNVGKGRTWTQAKAGALCEAIERYSCAYQDDEPSMISSLRELGGRGIHPNVCMNYSQQQYERREQSNKACSKFYFMVPLPFDELLKMPWTPVYSLTEERFRYLPSCFCYAQYPAEDELNLFCYPDSNGNAAGNSIEEAILQGFLELVERDSVALWWYNMLRKPAVDIESFQDPYFHQLIQYYRSLHRSLYVLDITADLDIPAFAAISARIDGGKEDIIFAFGAHVDAKIGVERALLELNQILPIVNISDTERAAGRYRTQDTYFLDWLNRAAFENQPYLRPLENVPEKKASDYPVLCDRNVYDSVMFCVETAKKHQLETFILDMTRPDVGLPVVKVIVPGLRHFWKRLAPGRLYDIPVKMGWRATALKEEELNPIGIFI